MTPHFDYPKGYTLVKDPIRSTWRKAIYEFTLDGNFPLTYVSASGVKYRTDRHFYTDQGSVPKLFCQLFVPKDRFLGFYLHDSAFIHGGLWMNEPQWEMTTEIGRDGMLNFVPKFVFREMTREKVDALLHDMVLADPRPGWNFTANCVWLGVRIGSLWTHYGEGDARFRRRVQLPDQYRSFKRFRSDHCEWCGTKNPFRLLQWCHEKPQALYPELKNDPDNGVTLCRRCHLCLNHGHNTKLWNKDLKMIVKTYGEKWMTERIKEQTP